MDPRINPFSPGAGAPPPELAGRGPILDYAAIALDRLRIGLHAKSMILVGLRGVGKTVVLNRIHMLAEEAGYQAAFIEAHEGKTLAEHYRHLVIHGFLHLLGFDHVEAGEAEAMEEVERGALARLGVADPYAEREFEELTR